MLCVMEVIIPEAEGTTHHSALPLRLGSAGSPDFGKEGGGWGKNQESNALTVHTNCKSSFQYSSKMLIAAV